MTRINIGIDPKTLHYRHLLAEHREIIRIPNTINSGRAKVKNIPAKFVLGEGHVKFFYDKLKYIHNRYTSLYNECKRRNFNVEDYSKIFDNIPVHLYNDYTPTSDDINIISQRIKERLEKINKK